MPHDAEAPDRLEPTAHHEQQPVLTHKPPRRPRHVRNIRNGAIVLALIGLSFGVWWVVDESNDSSFQAQYFAKLAKQVTYKVQPGPSNAIRYPSDSPYDERLGYANLPDYLKRLQARDFDIAAQARLSAKGIELADQGVYPPYPEKTRAGLSIFDTHQQPIFTAIYPERYYPKFDSAPAALVGSLLFIENRELLDTKYPKRNPAVEWDRFSKAVFDKAVHTVAGGGKRVAGGSTLATQIEKYRHSPEGRTASTKEKIRQMFSASLRSYQYGEDTSKVRHQLVIDYLNTVPLSAKQGYGEVNGIGDGMWVWYGREFKDVNRILRSNRTDPDSALVYKEALSLMIAQRRPSYYLGDGASDLETLTNSHLRVLAQAGVITPALRDAALKVHLHPSQASGVAAPEPNSFVSAKAANAVRAHLAGLLGDSRLYNLDRLDLKVVSTLDAKAQQAVTEQLRALRDPVMAAAAGLTGRQMLGNGDPAKVVYSFTLMEKGPNANYLRVQTDNFDQPLDINEGAKLDLGSTAKLRTLVTYMDIFDQLFKAHAGKSVKELKDIDIDSHDHLSRFAVDWMIAIPKPEDRKLPDLLQAALDRKYSASPGEAFFTGGGIHTFGNFNKEDNRKIMTVQEALRHSVNLVFVRLMRDVAYYYMFQQPESTAALLANVDDPRRAEYLARFADKEGKAFLTKFYQKYDGKTPAEIDKTLMGSFRPTASHLAAVHRTVWPNSTLQQFTAFINDYLPNNEVPPERIARMYETYAVQNMSLADRGYVASVHPLELWLVTYLRQHPKASLTEVFNASTKERQDVYAWLFKTHRKGKQDKRIKGLLEMEGFLKIHRQWKKMGYPFDSLVPSYATALGASADRPIALAELMGIIVNGGVRKPVQRVESLHFGKDTPYETVVKHTDKPRGEQVLAPEVARAVANAIREVVSDGTAKRAKEAFVKADGTIIPLGGKTGTGDQRFDVYAPGGRLVESRFVNRSATFVFNIGERFFGSMTAYVHGPEAKDYDFTSALPVQLLTVLAPSLMPMIDPDWKPDAAPRVAVAAASGASPAKAAFLESH
ncbi:glycosyl transferase family 51 [Massilia arenosa]|uniref:peptidoglycan glycosyltransferase n=1 Tax=Zemynaea arenosa TaxID=2561931 RepID=A0A4Y9SKR7_9BURK|nr:transglycosylase domain-containing protein [Massilia arenosa]TFW23895.1 glycosyl transferase family 51 [Massilia arenosa]